jgi:hypothetical protein
MVQEDGAKQMSQQHRRTKNHYNTTWASVMTEQCQRLITSMPQHIAAVIRAKGDPTMY